MTATATLAGRTVPVATAQRWVSADRYLDAVCRANRAEAKADFWQQQCQRLLERSTVPAVDATLAVP